MSTLSRVLILSEGFPPDRGGVATSTKRIAEGLRRLGPNVTVLTYLRGTPRSLTIPAEISTTNGVRLLRVGPFFKAAADADADTDRALWPTDKHKAILRRRFLSSALVSLENLKFRPDIVLSLYLLNAGFIATFLASELKIPHVAGVRGNDIGRNILDPSLLFATQFVLDRASHIVSVNDYLAGKMTRAFPHLREKTSVIPNSISPQEHDRLAARRRLLERTQWPADVIVCAFVGSFREKKGSIEIVRAFARLYDDDVCAKNVRLLLVSPPLGLTDRTLVGPDLDRLCARGQAFHHPSIPRDDLRPLISGADVLLQPSLDDGMANSLLEGMSVGLCPIVSPIFSDVVRQGEGILLPHVSDHTIAEAVLLLLTDPERRNRISRSAVLRSRDFSTEREAESYATLFTSILASF